MPGPYAHLTLVRELEKTGSLISAFRSSGNMPETGDDRIICCILGTVSPDFPNLASPESGDAVWADAMHLGGSGGMIVRGIELLRHMPESLARTRCFAWLLGYCAHVVADAVIHPVVQMKVGPYETNVFAHRRCELHQDFHIAPLLGLGDIGASPSLNSLLERCIRHEDQSAPILDIAPFWSDLLAHCHPALFQRQAPDIHAWCRNALRIIDEGDAAGYHLFPLAWRILAKTGLRYPASGTGDAEYVENLRVPVGEPMSYAAIFAKAVSLTDDAWKVVSGGVHDGYDRYLDWFSDWNLDTGCVENGRFALW